MIRTRKKGLEGLLDGGADGRIYIDGGTVYALRQFIFKHLGVLLVDNLNEVMSPSKNRRVSRKSKKVYIDADDVGKALGGARSLLLDVIATTLVDLITDDNVFKNLGLGGVNPYQVRKDAWDCIYGQESAHLKMLCEDILDLRFEVVQKMGLQLMGILMQRLQNYRNAQLERDNNDERVVEIIEIPISGVKGLKKSRKTKCRCKGGCKNCRPRKYHQRRAVLPVLAKSADKKAVRNSLQLELFAPDFKIGVGGYVKDALH